MLNIKSNSRISTTFDPPAAGQHLVNQCYQWSTNNKMILNASKTKVMNLSLRKELLMTGHHVINNTHSIETTTCARLLGVDIDRHLKFDKHIERITTSARRKTHGILVLKQTGLNSASLVTLYKTQIIPTLTHASPAWYPFTTDEQRTEIEKCQKLALRIIFPSIESYGERMATAQVTTLCDVFDKLCQTYIHGLVRDKDHPLHSRLPFRSTQRTSSRLQPNPHIASLYIPKARTAKRRRCLTVNKKYLQHF